MDENRRQKLAEYQRNYRLRKRLPTTTTFNVNEHIDNRRRKQAEYQRAYRARKRQQNLQQQQRDNDLPLADNNNGYIDASFTSLPCNCPTHYVPVCAKNGNTYSSECIAKCLGFQENEIEYGACSTWDPCRKDAYDCPVGMQCLEQRKVCLSSMHRQCLQYSCHPVNTSCDTTLQPVCDRQQRTYATPCDLLRVHAHFGHWGSCFRSCSWKGPVCGINGVTYPHECAAWADYIIVDYRSRCREVGLLTPIMAKRCHTIKCPSSPSKYCGTIVPPGACCSICAGAFRMIYSRKQIDRYAFRAENKDILTLHSVLRALDELVEIAECQLIGFLSMEVDIFVALVPRIIKPTRVQLEACRREAAKLSTFIESQSHRITTNPVLAGFIKSHIIEPTLASHGIGYSAMLTCWSILLNWFMLVAIIFI